MKKKFSLFNFFKVIVWISIATALLLVFVVQFNSLVYNQIVIPLTNKTSKNIDVKKLDNFTKIIDVREMNEYAVSTIAVNPNAKIFFHNSTEKILNSNEFLKTDSIIIYCTIGYRSSLIINELKQQGFKNTYNLNGGIINWANHKLPLSDASQKPTQKVHTYNWFWSVFLQNAEAVY